LKTIRFSTTEAEVPIAEIDGNDERYRLSYGRPLDGLLHSLDAIGLKRRILLQAKESGGFRVVSGWRRLTALKKRGASTVPAAIVSEETPFSDLFLFNFFDNADRGFNAVEQALAVQGLRRFLKDDTIVREYLPYMGLPPQGEVLYRFLSVAEMSPAFRPALLEGRLFPETMATIRKEFPSLGHFLPALLLFLRFSFQKQKAFLADLKETAVRRQQGPETVLEAPSLQQIFQAADWNALRKGEEVRKVFKTLLFPVLTECEERFRSVMAEGKLDGRTQIIPPPFFEGGAYQLHIRFSNPRELADSLKRVEDLAAAGKLDALP